MSYMMICQFVHILHGFIDPGRSALRRLVGQWSVLTDQTRVCMYIQTGIAIYIHKYN